MKSGWERQLNDKRMTVEEAAGLVKSGEVIYVNGAAGFPVGFMEALVRRRHELHHVTIVHPMRAVPFPAELDYVQDGMEEHFFHVSDFVLDPPIRAAVRAGRAAYRPAHTGEDGSSYPGELDWLIACTSRADRHGFFNFGVWPACIMDFLPKAKHVLLEENPSAPRCRGNNYIHISDIYGYFEHDHPIINLDPTGGVTAGPVEQAIAANVASLVEDGSTIQMGFGTIPSLVADMLMDKKDLGIHSELFGDAMLRLIRAGVVTGRRKSIHKGKVVHALALGTKDLYDFIDDNPLVEAYPISYTNNPTVIAQNHKQVSINATVQVDFMGQAASESIGPVHYSGIGGQWEFIRGAGYCPGGKGIIVLPSTAKAGTISTIVPMMPAGTPVSITRNDIQYVVTENGVANLVGRTIPERARALIGIAHPSFRKELEARAREMLLL